MADETDPTPKFIYDTPMHRLLPADPTLMGCCAAMTYDTGPIDRADQPHIVSTDESPHPE